MESITSETLSQMLKSAPSETTKKNGQGKKKPQGKKQENGSSSKKPSREEKSTKKVFKTDRKNKSLDQNKPNKKKKDPAPEDLVFSISVPKSNRNTPSKGNDRTSFDYKQNKIQKNAKKTSKPTRNYSSDEDTGKKRPSKKESDNSNVNLEKIVRQAVQEALSQQQQVSQNTPAYTALSIPITGNPGGYLPPYAGNNPITLVLPQQPQASSQHSEKSERISKSTRGRSDRDNSDRDDYSSDDNNTAHRRERGNGRNGSYKNRFNKIPYSRDKDRNGNRNRQQSKNKNSKFDDLVISADRGERVVKQSNNTRNGNSNRRR